MEIKEPAHRIKERECDIILWHYTSPEVFWKMLSGEFYATHYRFMNDSAEIVYGIQALDAFLKKEKTLQHLQFLIDGLQKMDFFLLCFSKQWDQLYQWRSYTPKEGGFSIGFSYNGMCDVFNNIKHDPQDEMRLYYDLLQCQYPSGDDITAFMRETFGKIQKVIDAPAMKRETLEGQSAAKLLLSLSRYLNVISHLFSKIPARCPAFKNPSFAIEEEYRLVVTGGDLRKGIEFIGNKPRIRIPTPELAKCIKGVYVSPHGDVEQNHLLAEIAKERFGLDFKIHESESTFNGR